jgi:hypothetical protein
LPASAFVCVGHCLLAHSGQSRHRNILFAIGIKANITQRLFVANISCGDDFNSGGEKSLFSRENSLFGQNNSLFR